MSDSTVFSLYRSARSIIPTDGIVDRIEPILESIESNALTRALKQMFFRDFGSYRPHDRDKASLETQGFCGSLLGDSFAVFFLQLSPSSTALSIFASFEWSY